jgi:hypothetical protein
MRRLAEKNAHLINPRIPSMAMAQTLREMAGGDRDE